MRVATRIFQALPFYPITSDQLAMLEEESVTDPAAFYADFHLVPQSLDEGLRRGLAFMTLHFQDEVATNLLTIDATDPKSGTAEFKATAICIERLGA